MEFNLTITDTEQLADLERAFLVTIREGLGLSTDYPELYHPLTPRDRPASMSEDTFNQLQIKFQHHIDEYFFLLHKAAQVIQDQIRK